MPIGYQYDYCLPPKVKILGDGKGAKLRAIIGNRGEIFSVEVVREGRNYTKKGTSLVIIDNSGHGRGAQADPVVKDGKIKHVVIISSGSGYCPNVPYSDPSAEGPLDEVQGQRLIVAPLKIVQKVWSVSMEDVSFHVILIRIVLQV